MQIKIGDKIRELRRRDGRRQEDLANALGVTCQAVSRWEANGGYPDMEMIPAISNYFGITIDELFGYHSDRETKIDAILAKIDAFDLKRDSDDGWVDECLRILREGLAEFPGNERLRITLAETLWEAGWRRHDDWCGYDDDGTIRYCYDRGHRNPYWAEADKICCQLIEEDCGNSVYTRAIAVLVPLYRNYGEYEKAIAFANRMPGLTHSREYLLTEATDGRAEAKYIGEFLLKTAREFSEQLIFSLISDLDNFTSDVPVEKVKGAIAMFDLICDDGNMGTYHDFVQKLWLYLSRLQWERGYHDEAFVSLDRALDHARAFDRIADGEDHTLTAPLVRYVIYNAGCVQNTAKRLPEDWPFWCNPDHRPVEKEIKADPRWEAWVRRTQA